MLGLRGILLEVSADDADLAVAVLGGENEAPARAEWHVVLGDLVALGKVGVPVVLAMEESARRDAAIQREPKLHRPLDRLLVRHGESPGVRETDRAGARVPLLSVDVLAPAEHLRPRLQLNVDLEPDDGLPASHAGAPGRNRSRALARARGRHGRGGSRRTAVRLAGARPEGLRRGRTGSRGPAARPCWTGS